MMRGLTRRGRAARLAGLVVASVVALTVTPAGMAAAVGEARTAAVTCSASAGSTPGEGGVDMSATIIGPATSPCDAKPGGSSSGGPSSTQGGASGNTNGSGSPSVATPAAVDTGAELPAPGPDEVGLGGVLNVGGLSSAYRPSINPLGGDLELSFTVRNVSRSTVDATADFWMEGPFGLRISSAEGVAIAALKPGETRTVSASLAGVGQWTVLTAHTTFRPPELVDGTALTPLTRDATVFAFPWFVVALIALALASGAVILLLRRRENTAPIGAFA